MRRAPFEVLRLARSRASHVFERQFRRERGRTAADERDAAGQQLRVRKPTHPARRPVRIQNGTGCQVVDEDGVTGSVEDGAIALFGGAQRVLEEFRSVQGHRTHDGRIRGRTVRTDAGAVGERAGRDVLPAMISGSGSRFKRVVRQVV